MLKQEHMFNIQDVWKNRSRKMVDFLKAVHVLDVGKCEENIRDSRRLSLYVVFHIEGVTYRMDHIHWLGTYNGERGFSVEKAIVRNMETGKEEAFSNEKKKWVWLAFCVMISDYHLLYR